MGDKLGSTTKIHNAELYILYLNEGDAHPTRTEFNPTADTIRLIGVVTDMQNPINVPNQRYHTKGGGTVDISGTPLETLSFNGLVTREISDYLRAWSLTGVRMTSKKFVLQSPSITDATADKIYRTFNAIITNYNESAPQQGGVAMSCTFKKEAE